MKDRVYGTIMSISEFKEIIEKCVNQAKQARTHPAKLVILTKVTKRLIWG